jgi:hypothetical protein
MARIRTVKPDFFLDSDLCELSPLHRLFFQGLWCHADREGRLEDKPRELKVRILPYDACEPEAMLSDLAARGFIERYSAKGIRVIQICNFLKHQRPHHAEPPSILPSRVEVVPTPSQDVPKPGDARLEPLGREGKGMEGNGEREPSPRALSKPDTTIPDINLHRMSQSQDAAFSWLKFHDEARVKAFPRALQDPPESGNFLHWYRAAVALVPDAKLREAYSAFLRDPWASKLTPPCPWDAWAKKWRGFVPNQTGGPPRNIPKPLKPGEVEHA